MADQHPQSDPQAQSQVPPADYDQYSEGPVQIEPEQDILVWEAASRPFKKRDREYYTTIAIIVFLLSLILLFAGQFLPIAVVISIGFLSYVLASVPPDKIINAITTYGIHSDKQFYFWDEVGRFWFTTKFKQPLLHIETSRFPNRITLLLGKHTEDELRTVLSAFLIEQQPLPTFLDKAADWLQEKIPLDKDEDTKTAQPKKTS